MEKDSASDEETVDHFHSSIKFKQLYPILLMLIAVPISMLFWVGNLAINRIWGDDHDTIQPIRWLAAILVPMIIASYGVKKKSLSKSGAILGVILGFFLTLSSFLFFVCLFTFFVTSSKATKFRGDQKKKFEDEFKEGGQRNWLQVLCNAGIGAHFAILYIIDSGVGEKSINFDQDYRATWLSIGILASFASCNGDTWASELGTVIGSSKPFLITTWKRVPKGTNGGVTIQGLIFSFAGGLVIGVAFYLAILYFVDPVLLQRSPSQWPVIICGGLAGLFGSLMDSFLGATLQYSGINKKTGVVVERPGPGVKRISGRPILDNHCVNLLSNILISIFTPKLAIMFWP